MSGYTKVSKVFICRNDYDVEDDSQIQKEYYRFLSQLNGLKIRLPLYDGSFSPLLQIRIREINYPDKLHIAREKGFYHQETSMFSIVVSGNWPLAGDRGRRFERYSALSDLDEISSKLICALSIYYPGSTKAFYSYAPSAPIGSFDFSCINYFEEIPHYLENIGIPRTPRKSLIEFISWTFERTGFWSKRAITNIDQALCLLTNMYHRMFSIENDGDLIWCVAGIESLFSDSSQGVSAQLRRRIKILMPELAKNITDKTINKIYAYRSRLVHGDIKVGSRFGEDWLDDTDMDVIDIHTVASSILIKSIHECCDRNLSKLSYAENIAN